MIYSWRRALRVNPKGTGTRQCLCFLRKSIRVRYFKCSFFTLGREHLGLLVKNEIWKFYVFKEIWCFIFYYQEISTAWFCKPLGRLWIFVKICFFIKAFFYNFRGMQWDENQDILTMRDVLWASVLIYKVGSKELGKGFQKVAETLNSIEGVQVTGRGIKDRTLTLQRKNKAKINKVGKASGLGGGKPSKFEILIEEIIINIS